MVGTESLDRESTHPSSGNSGGLPGARES